MKDCFSFFLKGIFPIILIFSEFQLGVGGGTSSTSSHDTSNDDANNHDTNSAHSNAAAHSLFNCVADIKPLSGSLSIIIVIGTIIFIEKIFHYANHITDDTPFGDLISRIEKELMIVGTMAFLFKILLNTTDFSAHEEWVLALEYADLVIPILSFAFCMQGLVLVAVLIREFYHWSKSYRKTIGDILAAQASSKAAGVHSLSSLLEAWSVSSSLEFRVCHIIFCDQYLLAKDAFAFDEYCQLIFEKFLLDVVTLRFVDWIYVTIFVLLNWCRAALSEDVCHVEDRICIIEYSTKTFTIFGFIMVAFTVGLAWLSRYYLTRIMADRGILDYDHHAQFLKDSEDDVVLESETKQQELTRRPVRRLNAKDLQKAIGAIKEKKLNEENKADMARIQEKRRMSMASTKSPKLPAGTVVPSNEAANVARSEGDSDQPPSMTARKKTSLSFSDNLMAKSKARELEHIAILEENTPMEQVFFLRKAWIFFEFLFLSTMVSSFYLALWITNFVAASRELPNRMMWRAISLLPALLCVGANVYVMKNACLLKAIVKLDHEVIAEVFEEAEALSSLRETVKQKIISQLDEKGDPEAELANLFAAIDENNSNKINRKEFQQFLSAMGIIFSFKRCEKLFRHIDNDFDEEIDYNEMIAFLFPRKVQRTSYDEFDAEASRRTPIDSGKVLDPADISPANANIKMGFTSVTRQLLSKATLSDDPSSHAAEESTIAHGVQPFDGNGHADPLDQVL